MLNKLFIKLCVVILLITPLYVVADSVKEIHLVIPRPLDSPKGKFVVSVYQEAYQRLGIELHAKSCQALQCALYVKRNEVDGELARTTAYERKVPGLVRVQQPSHFLLFSGYSANDDIRFSSFEDLKNSPFRIAYISGYFELEKEFEAFASSPNIIKVSSWNNGLAMLKDGKADVFIGIEDAVQQGLSRPEFQHITKVATLKKIPAYSYLNNKHASLAKQVALILKEMHKSGRISELYDAAMQ